MVAAPRLEIVKYGQTQNFCGMRPLDLSNSDETSRVLAVIAVPPRGRDYKAALRTCEQAFLKFVCQALQLPAPNKERFPLALQAQLENFFAIVAKYVLPEVLRQIGYEAEPELITFNFENSGKSRAPARSCRKLTPAMPPHIASVVDAFLEKPQL